MLGPLKVYSSDLLHDMIGNGTCLVLLRDDANSLLDKLSFSAAKVDAVVSSSIWKIDCIMCVVSFVPGFIL